MPRAYTKSGSVEKYESSQWATPVWSSSNKGSITGPDSNGNYTVNAPSGYSSGGSDISCTTNYGGVEKKFWFYKSGPKYCIVTGFATYIKPNVICGISISEGININSTNVTWHFNNGLNKSTFVNMKVGTQQFTFSATESNWTISNSISYITILGYSDGYVMDNGYILKITVRH